MAKETAERNAKRALNEMENARMEVLMTYDLEPIQVLGTVRVRPWQNALTHGPRPRLWSKSSSHSWVYVAFHHATRYVLTTVDI